MKGNRASIHFQNVQLYVFGILANATARVYLLPASTLTSR